MMNISLVSWSTLKLGMQLLISFIIDLSGNYFWKSDKCQSPKWCPIKSSIKMVKAVFLWAIDQLISDSLLLLLCSDVHGFHPHGAPGQEAESEPGRTGTRAGEGHRQHERSERPRPQEERQEVLLRGSYHLCRKNSSWIGKPESLEAADLSDLVHNRPGWSVVQLWM